MKFQSEYTLLHLPTPKWAMAKSRTGVFVSIILTEQQKLILGTELGARVSVSFLALAHKNKKQKNIRILLLGYTILKIYAASNGCLFKPLVSPWIRRHTMTSFSNYVDVPDKIWFIL